jgi:transposase
MGWIKTARREHDRSRLRYASDYTDEEWAIVRPLSRRTSRVGRPRKHKARTLWDAIQYIASTGCQWAQLPKDFPPFTTVQYHFYRMRDNGLLGVINAVLVAWVRVSECRTPAPTAGADHRPELSYRARRHLQQVLLPRCRSERHVRRGL